MRISCINKSRAATRARFHLRSSVSAVIIIAAAVLQGCAREPDARALARRAQQSYLQAVAAYEKLIAAGGTDGAAYAELGELYLRHGEYQRAADVLKNSSLPAAAKNRALALYFLGDATGALDVFDRLAPDDDEARYYHGLTCEKLNLYDQALRLYGRIGPGSYAEKAARRAHEIERVSGGEKIADVDPQVAALIAAAPAGDAYPEAGALVLALDEEMTVSDRGTAVSTARMMVKILNERGKESYAEAQIPYDSTFEKVEIEYARAIRPDGTVVNVGTRHIRDVSRYLNFPLYSNARVRIISFPEIAVGSVVEYKVKIFDNNLIDKKHIAFAYTLMGHDPILQGRFAVSVPEDKTLSLKTVNGDYNDGGMELKPDIAETGAVRSYRWNFAHIPQIVPEQGMPPDVEINPMIVLSTFESWEEVYRWWWGLAKDKIAVNDEIRRAVRELTAGMTLPDEKARAIYNFCARQIRYVAVEYGQAGYEPHKAADIFGNKYGDCKDQAVLLTAMLREAGLKAYPVLIPTRECYNLAADFPAVIFNHCIAVVELDGGRVFLDPTAETCSFGDLPPDDQRRRVLIARDDGYELAETPQFGAEHNASRQSLSIALKPDGSIEAEKAVVTKGLYDQGQRFWLLYTMPDAVKEALSEKIQQVSVGAVLTGHQADNVNDLDKHVELRYTFTGPEYGWSAGKLQILPQLAIIDVASVARGTRRYPLDFRNLSSSEQVFEIALPAGYKVQYLPADVSEDSPWMKSEVTYKKAGRRITVRQHSSIKTSMVQPADYPAFQSFLRNAAQQMRESIVLARDGK